MLLKKRCVLVISPILRPSQRRCQSETKYLKRNPKNDALSLYTNICFSHPAHLKYYNRFKNVSSYLCFAHGANAVCRSNVKRELHGEGGCCRYPYWHRSDIIQSQSGHPLLQWAAMARLTFQLRNSPFSICSGIHPDAEKWTKKMPVQTVKITLNDFPRKQERLRLTSFNITTILGAATHARTHTDARTLAVWAFVCFWVYIKCVKGNISACLQIANTYVNESTLVNVPMLWRLGNSNASI